MKTLLLILSITFLSNVSFSNIIYVDNFDAIYPWSADMWTLDIDGDGNQDIRLFQGASTQKIFFQSISPNKVQYDSGSTNTLYPPTFDCTGDTVNIFTSTWGNKACLLDNSEQYSLAVGNYKQAFQIVKTNPANGFLGSIYGYIDYSFNSSADVIIHGWYYEDSFGTPIIVNNLTCTPTSSTASHAACDSYTWIDGNTYSSSNNTATYTTTNSTGCDSLITLNLTVNSFTQSSIIETSCGSYTASDGQVYSSSGNYTATIPNISGCDSIISIDLTINPSTSSTDTHTACESYTWLDGNTYTSSNNTAIYSIPNGTNCDSVITLDLTINTTPANTVIQNGTALTATQTSATYQWIDCDNGNAPIVGEVNQSFPFHQQVTMQ